MFCGLRLLALFIGNFHFIRHRLYRYLRVSFYFMLFWGSLTISSGLSGRKPTADRHKADDIRHINHLHDLEVSSGLSRRQLSSGVLYKPLWAHGVLFGGIFGARKA